MLLPEIQEEYFGVFPTVLFKCPNFIDSMHFLMSLKKSSFEEKKDIITLMLHCGASISFDLQEATGNSILLVDHDDVVSFPGPAFILNYIKDCLDGLALLDISEYRQEATKHIASGFKCMSVVYFKERKWDSIVSTADRTWINLNCLEEQSLQDPFKEDTLRGIMSSTPLLDQSPDTEINTEDNNVDSSDTDMEKSCEDLTVLDLNKYDNLNKSDNESNTGDKLIEDSEKEKCQSNKIVEDIEKDKFSSKSSSKRADDLHKKGHIKPVSTQCRWNFLDDFESDGEEDVSPKSNKQVILDDSDSDEVEVLCSKPIKRNNLNDDKTDGEKVRLKPSKMVILDDDDSDEVEVLCSKPNERANLNDNESDGEVRRKPDKTVSRDDSDSDAEKVCSRPKKQDFLTGFGSDTGDEVGSKSNKRSRHPYSKEEKINILKYIVDRNEFSRVKGRELWVIMERKKVCPSRTWQSMKEHFLKKIVIDLELYSFLSNENKRQLRNACY